MPAKPPYPRQFAGYAAFDVSGGLLWGSISRDRKEAREYADQFDQDVKGYPGPFVVKPVFVGVECGAQTAMDF